MTDDIKIVYNVKLGLIGLDPNKTLCIALTNQGDLPNWDLPASISSQDSIPIIAKRNFQASISWSKFVKIYDDGLDSEEGTEREIACLYLGLTQESLVGPVLKVSDVLKIGSVSQGQGVEAKANGNVVNIQDACKSFSETIQHQNLAVKLLPPVFSMNDVVDIYRQSWPGINFDIPNFRRKIEKTGSVNRTSESANGAIIYTAPLTLPEIIPPFNKTRFNK